MGTDSRSTAAAQLAVPAEDSRRYSVLDLIILISVCAICLTLVLQYLLVGSIVCFLGSVVLTCFVYPRWRAPDVAAQKAAFDAIWGIVMPLVCLAPLIFDPATGVASAKPELQQEALLTAAKNPLSWFFGLEMLVLTAWSLTHHQSAHLAAAFFGALLPGFGVAGAIGLFFFPLSVITTLFWGLGVLGFTPLFTAFVYGRAMVEAVTHSQHVRNDTLTCVCELGGFTTVVGLSVLLGRLMALMMP